jgi:hypothetical protein
LFFTASQAEGRGFEPRFPLHQNLSRSTIQPRWCSTLATLGKPHASNMQVRVPCIWGFGRDRGRKHDLSRSAFAVVCEMSALASYTRTRDDFVRRLRVAGSNDARCNSRMTSSRLCFFPAILSITLRAPTPAGYPHWAWTSLLRGWLLTIRAAQ